MKIKFQSIFSKGLLVIAATSMVSCGGAALLGDEELNAASGEASLEAVQVNMPHIGSAFLFSIKIDDKVKAPSEFLYGRVVPSFVDPYAGCTTGSGDASDDDGDEIKKQYRREYHCQDVVLSPTFKESLVGFVDEIDKKDADSSTKNYLGGFKYTYNVEESVEGHENTRIKGSGTLEATNMSHTISVDTHISTKIEEAGYTGTIRQDSRYRIFPQDDAHPFAAGRAELSGFFGVQGTSTLHGKTVSFDTVFEIVGRGLVYSTCSGSFSITAGTVTLRDGTGNTVEFVYSGCNPVEQKYNGVAADLDPCAAFEGAEYTFCLKSF